MRRKLTARSGGLTAKQLEAWQKRHGLSISKASNALGVGASTFCALKAGERPVPPTMALLCHALDEIAELRERLGE